MDSFVGESAMDSFALESALESFAGENAMDSAPLTRKSEVDFEKNFIIYCL